MEEASVKKSLKPNKKNTSDRLTQKSDVHIVEEKVYSNYVEVDTSIEYQSMMGFGGAFTEAAAVTLAKMSKENRAQVIEKYYDKEKGLAYNIGRVHIHSCDFALGNYTYVEDGDVELKTFDIGHDEELIIPLVKDAMSQRGDSLEILASPWSPPAWMKSNNMMNQGGYLLAEYFQHGPTTMLSSLKHMKRQVFQSGA